ncbi:hypothetical protein SteCoe_25792 [Stentor coeruleus]|uniref:Uncharacterized protein n=1 Tax=Stentor coeruleus TaxID=5963 RepID=A0A1R2BEG2_9CILI|nr:hypothetical protein SteCoe_25792 [Stentor coeruleus]
MKGLKSIDPHCFENSSSRSISSRKVKAETKIRSQFISKGCRKFPKKEYIRCKMIRGHKRILRQIMSNDTYPKEFIESTNYNSYRQEYWNLLQSTFIKYKHILSEIIPVEVGPVNEIMKRKKMKIDHLKRSFNAEFCKEYLEKAETRESYFYYVEFLFSDFDCEKLIKRFGFKCCARDDHDLSCTLKWLLLKHFCSQIMLEDIGIEPYVPEEKFLPLPSLFRVL